MRRFVLLALLLAAVPASAQDVPLEVQAVLNKLNFESNLSLSCASARIVDDRALKAAQAEVKRLKDKYEPEEPKKDTTDGGK